jgi:hypothetical protein
MAKRQGEKNSGLEGFVLAGDTLMKESSDILYSNLKKLHANFERWRYSPAAANANKNYVGDKTIVERASDTINEALRLYDIRNSESYEQRIRGIIDTFNTVLLFLPGQEELELLFIGYKEGPKPFDNSYAPEANVKMYCRITEPKILQATRR